MPHLHLVDPTCLTASISISVRPPCGGGHNRTISRAPQPLKLCIKNVVLFFYRKPVTRRHIVLALHDPCTGSVRNSRCAEFVKLTYGNF